MTDPFADEEVVSRDRWGRPLIKQSDGTEVAYTRISTLANYVTDKTGIETWDLRCVALGFGNDPSLADLAGSYAATVDDLNADQKHQLDEVIAVAHDRGGGSTAARWGTAFHNVTEPDSTGRVPDAMELQRAAYWQAIADHDLQVDETELFVVNDELKFAGTLDHLVSRNHTSFVLDKKSGRKSVSSWLVQVAAYSRCRRYNPVTGERSELGASHEWGLVAHYPRLGGAAKLAVIPLASGWRGVLHAVEIREWRTEAGQVKF